MTVTVKHSENGVVRERTVSADWEEQCEYDTNVIYDGPPEPTEDEKHPAVRMTELLFNEIQRSMTTTT